MMCPNVFAYHLQIFETGKEIQLKHRAPVIAIQILDGLGHPLPEPFEVENKRAKAADLNGNHRVIICSEEQFKVSGILVKSSKIFNF